MNSIIDILTLFNGDIKGAVPENEINALVEWGLIPKEGHYKCKYGHNLRLCATTDNVDGWIWR